MARRASAAIPAPANAARTPALLPAIGNPKKAPQAAEIVTTTALNADSEGTVPAISADLAASKGDRQEGAGACSTPAT